jgi:STE24 endopeptidase
MTTLIFCLIFIAAVVASTLLRIYLSFRQTRCVRAHRGTVPTAFAEKISLPAHEKAADYTVAKQSLARIDAAADMIILLAWTMLGGLAALVMLTSGLPPLWQDVALLVGVALVGSVLGLPLSYVATFRIESRFGFNNTTFKLWLADLLKGLLVSIVIGVPLAALVLWLMNAAGTYWWAWTWLALMVFQLLMLVIYPTLIAPIFNKFKPLEDGPTKTKIEALLTRCGFAAKGLFVMDGSKRSSHGNAYFTGLGKAKRVVFFDTLLSRLSDDEIEAVLAHELGHFKRRHITKRLVFSAIMSLAMLALLAWLMGQGWFYDGLGMAGHTAEAMARPGVALALFMLVMPTFMFFFTPLGAYFSRKHEFEADRYAAENASADALSSALVRLYEDNASTLTPDPVYSKFYDSHPPASVRIANLQQTR